MHLAARLGRLALSVLLVGLWLNAPAHAYPDRPVHLIVPYPPGGTADSLTRIVAQKLGETLGQQVVVENRPGAGSIIGTEAAAKAAPDGYTLLMTSAGLTINASLYANLPYDTAQAFSPVSLVVTSPNLLVVNPDVPVSSVRELIALAKSKPGQLNYASAGTGTGTHLSGELFKSMAGVDIVHIPYKGDAPALLDVLAGRVEMLFIGPSPSMPHIKAGKLRALAVTTARRSSVAPDLPTVAESGLPGFEVNAFQGVVAPAGTPKEIVSRLHAAIVEILRVPDVRERLTGQGFDPVGSTPEEFGAFLERELAKWAKLIQAIGLRSEFRR